ncbi:MAG: hypothetical protein AB8B63_15270 [Granulosicoccus sp.]
MSANPSMMKTSSMGDSHRAIEVNSIELSLANNGRTTPSVEYRITYALVFVVCFAITALCRLLPRNRHPWIGAGDDGSSSLWSEARSAADSTVPYVFQQ